MAEGELITYGLGEICSYCHARTIYSADLTPRRYKCQLALLEQQLRRTPTAKDVREIGVGFSLDYIPSDCPNGYRSPENLPLR